MINKGMHQHRISSKRPSQDSQKSKKLRQLRMLRAWIEVSPNCKSNRWFYCESNADRLAAKPSDKEGSNTTGYNRNGLEAQSTPGQGA